MNVSPCPPITITGVEIKALVSHPDQRGFFREVVRVSDDFFTRNDDRSNPFGQWSHSCMQQNVVKAWHYHHQQYDWWYCAIGQIETVLFDNRQESPTYKNKMVMRMGDRARYGEDTYCVCVKIPPGVLHGLKVLSSEAHLFYITSQTYDANEEGRFPFNSELVGHAWGDNAITVENDRRTFPPTSKRQLIA